MKVIGGIPVYEDANCRSTKEFRVEVVTRRRTWKQRFHSGPVWCPRPETYQSLGMVGIPMAYKYMDGNAISIIAHPLIIESMGTAFDRGER